MNFSHFLQFTVGKPEVITNWLFSKQRTHELTIVFLWLKDVSTLKKVNTYKELHVLNFISIKNYIYNLKPWVLFQSFNYNIYPNEPNTPPLLRGVNFGSHFTLIYTNEMPKKSYINKPFPKKLLYLLGHCGQTNHIVTLT